MVLIRLIILLLMDAITKWNVYAKIYTLPPHASNLTRKIFSDRQADFGADIPDYGIVGVLEEAKPLNACLPVTHVRPEFHSYNVYALVEESKNKVLCPFDLQVMNCQLAGYHAVIVYNRVNSMQLKTMTGDGPAIPAVYVSKFSGENLKQYVYPYSSVQIFPNPELPLQLYLVPFAVVVGVCFFFMILFSFFRYLRYRIRQKRSRLSPANLKKIPTKKYKKGDEYDLCAICLDDYEEGEKIRILPCNHAYHCKCVDPWLTSGKKLCPVCKQTVEPKKLKKPRIDIIDGGSTSSYNDNSLYEGDETNEEDDTDVESNERTPLLSTQNSPPSNIRNV